MKRRSHEGSFGKPNITPEKIAARVEKWKHRLAHLGVSHFRITGVHFVDQTPGGPRADASVRPSEKYDSVEFWFRWSFLEDCDHYELDETIIHEWLHVAMRDFDESLTAVETWMPEKTYEDFEQTVNHEREGLVERLARIIAGLYYDTDR